MLAAIVNLFREYSYEIYQRPYELTILGIRSESTVPNRFDDEIHVLFKNNSKQWVHYIFLATTDPGTYWLKNPLNAVIFKKDMNLIIKAIWYCVNRPDADNIELIRFVINFIGL